MRGLAVYCQSNVLLAQRSGRASHNTLGRDHSDAVNSPGKASGETVMQQRLTKLDAVVQEKLLR